MTRSNRCYVICATQWPQAADDARVPRTATREGVQQTPAELSSERFAAGTAGELQTGIVACNAQGVLTLFNQATREFHGLPQEPLPADQWAEHYDLYRADGVTPLMKGEIPLFRALSGEHVRDVEMVIAPKQGKVRTVCASGQSFYDGAGKQSGRSGFDARHYRRQAGCVRATRGKRRSRAAPSPLAPRNGM